MDQIPIMVFAISITNLTLGLKPILTSMNKKEQSFLRCFRLPVGFNKQSLIIYSALCQIKSMAVWISASGQSSPPLLGH